MNIDELMQGVGIVIDDNVLNIDSGDSIIKLIDYFENQKHVPLVKYCQLPDKAIVPKLKSASFLLLDWELVSAPRDIEVRVAIPDDALKESQDDICEFIKCVIEQTCIPIFLFSNESLKAIEDILKAHKIFVRSKKSRIFLKQKNDLFTERECCVYEELGKWYEEIPALYLIKEWFNSYTEAETKSFLSMLGKSINWPSIMRRCFDKDEVNVDTEMSRFVGQLISAQMKQPTFDKFLLKDTEEKVKPKEVNDILESQCFIKVDNYAEPETGDLYKKDGIYYINIRPSCDCVMRDGATDVELYLLASIGSAEKYLPEIGRYTEKSNEAVIGPIEGKFRKFGFKKLITKSYNDIKEKRIGRILHPYITYVSEKYGLYIHRQGLPRIPKEAVYEENAKEEGNNKADEPPQGERIVEDKRLEAKTNEIPSNQEVKAIVENKFKGNYTPAAIVQNPIDEKEGNKVNLYKTETEKQIEKLRSYGFPLKVIGKKDLDKLK